ncbi:MAG: sodium:proton antiporter [Roseivirga sp.]|nr:sodium:proton antiporter [Roseivirga sp.]
MKEPKEIKVRFIHALMPVLFLSILIGYGLIARPLFFGQTAFPLEVVFLIASMFSIGQLLIMGFEWDKVLKAIVKKLARGLPAVLILFAIGVIIGSWIISGTIPMLIYYGIKMINPDYIYVLSFLIPIIFSTLTGTSWGSVGTIGVVLIGMAGAIDADLAITAGAIVGGAYFGDKISPLSDTTNLAALAAEVDLYDHIRSMMNTTLPAALIATLSFLIIGFVKPVGGGVIDTIQVTTTLTAIEGMFHFNLFLFIPPLVVLYGSITRKATLPTLLTSSMVACILALIFQDYTMENVITALNTGFDTSMATWMTAVPENVITLFTRGGLYELNFAIMLFFMIFTFVGSIDMIDAMPTLVNRVFAFAKTRSTVILSSLFASAFTNVTTSNQSATSFIVGDAFSKKYDQYCIPRKVLSRSIEDYGTMIENIIPWTTTGVFMAATLGVPVTEYWHSQLMTLANLIIAPILAITGRGCFYKEKN